MIYQLDPSYYVRPLRQEDLDGPYPSWFEDQEVCQYNRHGKFPKNQSYFRTYIDDSNREDRIVWAICHGEDGHIGNIALEGLSLINRSGEFAIIMGDRRHWGRGVATMAGRTLLRHGFLKLNLHRIVCGTAATNMGMRSLALALGMQQEGVRRESLFLEGAWVDMVEFGILRSEYKG